MNNHGIWQETLHALELPDAKSSTSNSPKSRGFGFGFWRLAASFPGMDGYAKGNSCRTHYQIAK